MQMNAPFAVNEQRVLDVKAVERHRIFAYRRGERVLKKADLVIVYVYIRKEVLECSGEYFPRLHHVADAICVLSHHHIALFVRLFAVDVLRYCFGEGDWKYQFAVVGARLYQVNHARYFAYEAFLQF